MTSIAPAPVTVSARTLADALQSGFATQCADQRPAVPEARPASH